MVLVLMLPPISGANADSPGSLVGGVEAGVTDVADSWCEPVAEQVHEGEEMIGVSGRVRVMLLNCEVGLVMEQPVQDVGRVAVPDVDELAVEGEVLV